MVNLTTDFVKIVQQVEKEKSIEPRSQRSGSLIDDTFIKESIDLYTHVIKLREFIESVKPEYLLSDASKYTTKSEEALTEDQRDEIDTQSRIELKKFTERLKHLEKYEDQRANSKKFFKFNKPQAETINKHRAGILLSLSHELRSTSKLLLSMQEVRLSRQRDLELAVDRISSVNVTGANYNLIPEEPHHNQMPEFDGLSQEQLQVLQTEQSEILDGKLEDLAKVEQIHKGVLEIAQLEAQLAGHLQVQSENINSLVNDHGVAEVEIVGGHKILKKNKGKGNAAARYVMIVALTLGFILLFFDYIN